jgi:hypothetical protein
MAGKYELKKSDGGKYFFNLKAGNHEVILTGELYETKGEAEAALETVRQRGGNPGNFERKISSASQPFFVLFNETGNALGRSEMYSSEKAMENGIESVGRNAATAGLADLTV